MAPELPSRWCPVKGCHRTVHPSTKDHPQRGDAHWIYGGTVEDRHEAKDRRVA